MCAKEPAVHGWQTVVPQAAVKVPAGQAVHVSLTK
jgi:hypothetical protein